MPTYELSLIIRSLPRPELASSLKRLAEAIFDKGGIIIKIDNLGTRKLPYKMTIHEKKYLEGSYFIMEFITPPNSISALLEEYGRDIDVIRKQIFKKELEPTYECTIEDEMKPPPYRQEVINMIEEGKRKASRKRGLFKYNTGLDYYPFQK